MSGLLSTALRQRGLVLLLFVVLIAAGVAAFMNLNIEAYPDPVPPLVDIVTQSNGQSSEEMERNITIPIEVQMAGIPNVTAIRSISLFGLSDVKVQFTYDFTYEEAEQRVINRLSQLSPLPNNVQPQISPQSPIGEIFRYRLTAPKGFSVTELKTLQDWVLQRRFKAIPGVIDVTGWGGALKTYDVTVDLNKLVSSGVTLPQMIQTLTNSSINVGGQTINIGPQSAVVRGLGLIRSPDDIRNTVLASSNGTPVLVRDVAEVAAGNQPRLGITGQDSDDDIVQGVVLMRRGAQSAPTIKAVNDLVQEINAKNILPPGVKIELVYNRLDLIKLTTGTVLENIILGIVFIFFVQWIFLADLRSALIVACTIPFALFFAVIILVARGDSANLLSVGAIDFGLIVDASVIMMENIYRHLAEGHRTAAISNGPSSALPPRLRTFHIAGIEVGRSIFFSAAIIIAGFVPLFTLSGIEGHIFAPMAKTYAYALLGGLIATFTITPALSALFLSDKVQEAETFLVRAFRAVYRPTVETALDNRVATLVLAVILVATASISASRLGSEFLPKLEEGNFWIHAFLPPSISLEEGHKYVNRMRKTIASMPEVVTAVSQHGRPADGTDAAGFDNVEFFVPLKPADQWEKGLDKDKLTERTQQRLKAEFPGVDFEFSQTIQDNVAEAASGVKGENAVKIFGSDLATLEKLATKVKTVLSGIENIDEITLRKPLGQPSVTIKVDREKAARYGLATGDVNAVIQAAIGGQSIGDLYEEGGDKHFPTVVRLDKKYRGNIQAIQNISVAATTSTGPIFVPLSEIADIRLTSGAFSINREQQQRYIPITFSVKGRDLGGVVAKAQAAVEDNVKLPPGYSVVWVGEFSNLKAAVKRLSVVVPIGVLLIVLLLYLTFESVTDTLLAFSVIPMALVGGIFALAITGTPFSVSAAIGFIALFGIAAMNGIIVISSYNRSIDAGVARADAIRQTCMVQMRPVLMTCVAAGVGLLPAAFSTGIGSQVQKPLALVVVGGMILAPILILVVLPAAISLFSRAGRNDERVRDAQPEPAE